MRRVSLIPVTNSQQLQIVSRPLLPATQGSAYTGLCNATGGKAPYTWAILNSTGVNVWTIVPNAGVIEGTPMASETDILTIQVTDSLGRTATATLSLQVIPAIAPSPSGAAIPNATQLVDVPLNIWTVVNGVVYINGVTAGFSANVTLLLYYNGTIYQEAHGQWFSWNGAWNAVAGDPRIPTPPSAYPHWLPYMQSLGQGAGKIGVLVGQHSNEFPQSNSDSPMTGGGGVFQGSNPNWTVTGSGGLCPAVLDMNVQGPNNGQSVSIPTQQTLPSPIDFATIASQWLNSGRILQVSAFYNNPANPLAATTWLTNPNAGDGGNDQTHNPFPNILTSGTTINNTWIANLTQIATLLLKLNSLTGSKPFIFRHFHELTLGKGTGQWWWDIGAGLNFATGAQLAQLWRQTRDFFWNFTSPTYPGINLQNLYFQFNCNDGSDGQAAYPDTVGAAYVRGTSYVDCIGLDAYPPGAGDASVWNSFVAMAPGRFCIYGEAGVITFTNPSKFAGNNYTGLMQTVVNNCPHVGIVCIMSQNWALSFQNGATQAMSASGILNSSNLPANLYSST